MLMFLKPLTSDTTPPPPETTYPLGLASEGQWVRVHHLSGGEPTLKKLTAMGIAVGSRIRVIQREAATGLVIQCGETRLALGMGLAHKIIVEPTQEEQ